MLPAFEENLVAGGPDDFMTVRHLKLAGPNKFIGSQLADVAKKNHQVTVGKADPLMTEVRRHYIQTRYPMLFDRMMGVAESYGVSMDGDIDVASLAYDMNVRPGCSTVFYPSANTADGHSTLSRNYDFSTAPFPLMVGAPDFKGSKPMTADPYVLEMYPERGIPSLSMCAYDLLTGCIDGVNAEGLTVALLADDESMGKYPMEPTHGAQVGFDEISVTRYLLDTCTCVDDAKRALLDAKCYYTFVLCHYIIADRHGRSFVWEWSHAHNREFMVDGVGPQIVTNHPVHEYKTLDEMPKENFGASSYNRYRALSEQIAKSGPKVSRDQMKANNACVAETNQMYPNGTPAYPGRTLWHALYDTDDRSLEINYYLGEDSKADTGVKMSGYNTFQLKS